MAKKSVSELVLAAVFYMQQKNGVSVIEIADHIAKKKGHDPCKLRRPIKIVLTKAKEHGIMSECQGLYRIEYPYEDKLKKDELKPPRTNEDNKICEDNGNVPKELVAITKKENPSVPLQNYQKSGKPDDNLKVSTEPPKKIRPPEPKFEKKPMLEAEEKEEEEDEDEDADYEECHPEKLHQFFIGNHNKNGNENMKRKRSNRNRELCVKKRKFNGPSDKTRLPGYRNNGVHGRSDVSQWIHRGGKRSRDVKRVK